MCLLFVFVGWIDGWMDRDDVGSFDVIFNLFNHPVFHHGSIALFTFSPKIDDVYRMLGCLTFRHCSVMD